MGREDLAQAEVNILKKTLRRCLQKKDLVVMVLMVGKVTALFAHKFLVHHAVGHEALHVIGALVLADASDAWVS